jgi:hypothetical protein
MGAVATAALRVCHQGAGRCCPVCSRAEAPGDPGMPPPAPGPQQPTPLVTDASTNTFPPPKPPPPPAC